MVSTISWDSILCTAIINSNLSFSVSMGPKLTHKKKYKIKRVKRVISRDPLYLDMILITDFLLLNEKKWSLQYS
jgi:hypothetical protein